MDSFEGAGESFLSAARSYAVHGWPVLPGSAWNGRRFIIPGTTRATDGLRPIVPRNLATVEPAIIHSWWGGQAALPYSVLIRSCGVFALLTVPIDIGDKVLGVRGFVVAR